MTFEIPMAAIIGFGIITGTYGMYLLGRIVVVPIVKQRKEERKKINIRQEKENRQMEKETKQQERTKTEKLLPPEWLIMYNDCENAGNVSARRIWINTLLTRKITLPKLPMTAIINFAQLFKKEDYDCYDEKREKIIEQMAKQYLELSKLPTKTSTSDKLPDTFDEYCEKYAHLDVLSKYAPKPQKLSDPTIALYLKEQIPLQWYKFYENVSSCPIIDTTTEGINRIDYCRHKLIGGFLRKGKKPEPLSSEQACILANALSIDEELGVREEDAKTYIGYLIPFVKSPNIKARKMKT